MDNAEQIEYWNGEAGKRWAQDDDTMARLLRPISEALLEHAPLEGCKNALDIGCGGGSQSLMLAQRLGGDARVTGVDISEPMLEVARRKALEPAGGRAALEFLRADAATHGFKPGGFDLLFSRFGVMFFDDPAAAFTNLHGALRPGGRLAFSCWQAMKKNDWVRIPLQAALQHLPPPEPPPPNAPGPFAFADPARVESILNAAGFNRVALQPFETTLRVSQGRELPEAVRELARIGPVSRLLTGQPQSVLDTVFPAIEDALRPWFRNGALDMQCAVWLVTGEA
ncbi:MAG: methyltransferase domain-containing protein [Gammaproteobacteria bacterium]|nr:methyltransferase domain-containing protein [Gammaproteobacteria bacterium]